MTEQRLVKSLAPTFRALTEASKGGRIEDAQRLALDLYEREKDAITRARNPRLFWRLLADQEQTIWEEVPTA